MDDVTININTMTWEDSFSIAQALKHLYPDLDLKVVSLEHIYHWTLNLPGFDDDPELANENILNDIYQEWYEENNPI
jgi:FeS assembly protein IscX